MKLTFYGAASTVTGSCYLVETQNTRFLVDCGMFQGPGVEQLNLEEFSFDPSSIDFVLLTHAHIDHSGLLPKLTANGFTGNIYATYNTIKIASELLLDSAKIQEENFTRGLPYGKYTPKKGIAYTTQDTENTISKFKLVYFDETFIPSSEVEVTYRRAGHILGAASIEITIQDNRKEKRIVFSGDIGRLKPHLDESFDLQHTWNPNYILMESLYGGVVHPDRDESAAQLVEIINDTINRGGNVYIPSFAVQRTQEVLNDLKVAKENGTLDPNIEVWLDSPLAQKITKIYISALQTDINSLFDFEGLRYVRNYSESIRIRRKRGIVVIAGSGMADGGRIVEHLFSGLSNRKNTVAFVGFQAEGTLGRDLTTGAKRVEIDRKKIQVRCKIEHLKGFSAHGDHNDYLEWIQRYKSSDLRKVFLIHAEVEKSKALRYDLNQDGIDSVIPCINDTFEI